VTSAHPNGDGWGGEAEGSDGWGEAVGIPHADSGGDGWGGEAERGEAERGEAEGGEAERGEAERGEEKEGWGDMADDELEAELERELGGGSWSPQKAQPPATAESEQSAVGGEGAADGWADNGDGWGQDDEW
tara:strand:- start:213 stop:608 length:396 start_codon:yes stop_codon:yes gene_type:complete